MTSFLFGREEEERVTGKISEQAESPACTINRTSRRGIISTSRRFMFTVDLNDGQWLQCMCTQILNTFTINKGVMHADVVTENGGASCDVDGRIWSRYCGCIILECGMLAGVRWVSSLRLRVAWLRKRHECVIS